MAFGFVSAAIAVTLLFSATAASGQNVSNNNVSTTNCASDMPFMLLQIQADVQGSLNNLDADVANAAQNLSTASLEGDAAHQVLHKLLDTNSNLVEAMIFGKDGKIISEVECEGARAARTIIHAARIYCLYILTGI
jgi:polar amino acid transport system substrate-binding protein